MSNWISITKDTLYEAKVAALVDSCDTAALAQGQPPRAAGIIQGVVNSIRNAVGTCQTNQVDDDETKIPKSLRDLAVDLINARLKNTLEMALTEDERDNVAYHRRQLDKIAACDLDVEQPDVPVAPPTQSGPGSQLIRPGGGCNPFSGLGTT